MSSTRLCVLGAGSWGTALALAFAPRFKEVRLWGHNVGLVREMATARENRTYLPGFSLPRNVEVHSEFAPALADVDVVLCVIPSKYLRTIIRLLGGDLPAHAQLVSATKGLEEGSLRRMSEVIKEELIKNRDRAVTVLSGPAFAKEIAAGELAALVIASEKPNQAEEMQHTLATPQLRFYASTDVIGVEIGAALKNVIAIGAGVCSGLGMGSNTTAALVTRGLAEITRLAVKMGGQPRTLSGLAGLGDLVLTTTGSLSRNRQVGMHLGQGHRLHDILRNMKTVAEGVGTCRAAYLLGQREAVDLPIINKMHEILYEGKDPRGAVRELMERPLTIE